MIKIIEKNQKELLLNNGIFPFEPFFDDYILYNRKEVLIIFKVSASTLYNWNKNNVLNSVKIGGKVFYTNTSINKLVYKKQIEQNKFFIDKTHDIITEILSGDDDYQDVPF
jgi:hypothetical protein